MALVESTRMSETERVSGRLNRRDPRFLVQSIVLIGLVVFAAAAGLAGEGALQRALQVTSLISLLAFLIHRRNPAVGAALGILAAVVTPYYGLLTRSTQISGVEEVMGLLACLILAGLLLSPKHLAFFAAFHVCLSGVAILSNPGIPLRAAVGVVACTGFVSLMVVVSAHLAGRREKQLAELDQVIRESEASYRDLVENAEELICTHDAEGKILTANRAIVRILGRRNVDDVVGHRMSDFMTPATKHLFDLYLRRILKTGRAHGMMEIVTNSGDVRILEYMNTLKTEADGRVIVRGVSRDITERRLAELEVRRLRDELEQRVVERTRELQRSQHAFMNLAKVSRVGMFRADPAGSCVYVNERFRELTGLFGPEVFGVGWFGAIHPEDAERVTQGFLSAVRNRTQFEMEFRLRPVDGQVFWVLGQAQPEIEPSGQPSGWVVTITDITEVKLADQALLERQERVGTARKMEALSRLAGGLSHDFNNLLAILKGYVELLQEDIRPGDPRFGYVANVNRAIDRATDLTRQLLTFSTGHFSQGQAVDVNQLLDQVRDRASEVLGGKIHLAIFRGPDVKQVVVDQDEFEGVILNLLTNAKEAMADGGVIELETRNARLTEEQRRKNPGVGGEDLVQITVRDTGKGIDPEILKHVFEPFFTTKQGEGLGLGLSNAYGVVTQHEGFLEVESRLGIGTAVHIFLPAVSDSASAPASDPFPDDAEPVSQSPDADDNTVLLVDDEMSVRKLALVFLQRAGYHVIEAADATEALARSRQHAGPIAAVLTDLTMSGMAGDELARQLVAERPNIRVIFMSGFVQKSLGARSKFPDAAFLTKPFTARHLLRALRDTLPSSARAPNAAG